MSRNRGHYSEPGTIKSAGESDFVHHKTPGKHIRVEVVHGRRSKPPKPKKGEANTSAFHYDDRRTTSFHVPAHMAHHFPVGQKVKVSLHPVKASKKGRVKGAVGSLDPDSDDSWNERLD